METFTYGKRSAKRPVGAPRKSPAQADAEIPESAYRYPRNSQKHRDLVARERAEEAKKQKGS